MPITFDQFIELLKFNVLFEASFVNYNFTNKAKYHIIVVWGHGDPDNSSYRKINTNDTP